MFCIQISDEATNDEWNNRSQKETTCLFKSSQKTNIATTLLSADCQQTATYKWRKNGRRKSCLSSEYITKSIHMHCATQINANGLQNIGSAFCIACARFFINNHIYYGLCEACSPARTSGPMNFTAEDRTEGKTGANHVRSRRCINWLRCFHCLLSTVERAVQRALRRLPCIRHWFRCSVLTRERTKI